MCNKICTGSAHHNIFKHTFVDGYIKSLITKVYEDYDIRFPCERMDYIYEHVCTICTDKCTDRAQCRGHIKYYLSPEGIMPRPCHSVYRKFAGS